MSNGLVFYHIVPQICHELTFESNNNFTLFKINCRTLNGMKNIYNPLNMYPFPFLETFFNKFVTLIVEPS
jgi:hypothetical protein